MADLTLPPEDPAPNVTEETAADADVRDLTNEISGRLEGNGHQVQIQRYAGWSRLTVLTPQGFTFDVPLIQQR